MEIDQITIQPPEIKSINIKPIIDKYNKIMKSLFDIYNNLSINLKDCLKLGVVEYKELILPKYEIQNHGDITTKYLNEKLIKRLNENINRVLELLKKKD